MPLVWQKRNKAILLFTSAIFFHYKMELKHDYQFTLLLGQIKSAFGSIRNPSFDKLAFLSWFWEWFASRVSRGYGTWRQRFTTFESFERTRCSCSKKNRNKSTGLKISRTIECWINTSTQEEFCLSHYDPSIFNKADEESIYNIRDLLIDTNADIVVELTIRHLWLR